MLARLQRVMLAGTALLALAWLGFWWPARPGVAVGGVLALLAAQPAVLAWEFVWARQIARRHGQTAWPWPVVARLWAREVKASTQVFAWRQPFFSARDPDQLPGCANAADGPTRGVVLVHGIACNRGFWGPWLATLASEGRPFVAVNLEPPWAPIEAHLATVGQAVAAMVQATGQPPVLVGQSMGGIVARAWLREAGAHAPVHHVVTVAAPHQGTVMARLARRPPGVQMRRAADGGRWLQALNAQDPWPRARLTCWYSDGDNIITPPDAATLPGADNRLLPAVPHVALAFEPAVRAQVWALMDEGAAGRH